VDCYRSLLAGVAGAIETAVPVGGIYVRPPSGGAEQAQGAGADGNDVALAAWLSHLLQRLRATDEAPFACLEAGRISAPAWVVLLLMALPPAICIGVILNLWLERGARHATKTKRRAVPPSAMLLAPELEDSEGPPAGGRASAETSAGGLSLWTGRAPSFLLRMRAAERAEAAEAEAAQAKGAEAAQAEVQHAEAEGAEASQAEVELAEVEIMEIPESTPPAPTSPLPAPARQALQRLSSVLSPASVCQTSRSSSRSSSFSLPGYYYLLPWTGYRLPSPQYRLVLRTPPAVQIAASSMPGATIPGVTHTVWCRLPAAVSSEAIVAQPTPMCVTGAQSKKHMQPARRAASG